MNNHLEDDLTKTFAAAAKRAPTPPPDLVERVNAGLRRHRHRRHGQVAAVAIAIVAVTGGTLVAPRLLSGEFSGQNGAAASSGQGPGRAAANVPGPDLSEFQRVSPKTPKPVDEVWPETVHRVSNRLPDGRKYLPETFVDNDTLLVATDSAFEKTDEVSLYNLKTKRVTSVARVHTSSKIGDHRERSYATDFTVGDGYVAWWMGYAERGRWVIEVWAAPMAGGGSKRIAVQQGATSRIDHLAIADGKATWSLEKEGGVYQTPLTGGQPTLLPDTGDYHIVTWPWIGTPLPILANTNEVGFAKLRNVKTGEQRGSRLAPKLGWNCALAWCIGSPTGTFDDTNELAFAQRRNGSGGRVLPTLDTGAPEELPILDRFIVFDMRARSSTQWDGKHLAVVLYDLETGKNADLGIELDKHGGYSALPPDHPGDRLYAIDTKDGYLLIDPAAIK